MIEHPRSPDRTTPKVHAGRDPTTVEHPDQLQAPASTPIQGQIHDSPNVQIAEARETQAIHTNEGEEAAFLDQRYVEMHQRQRKALLAKCARVQLLNFQALAMPAWPEAYALAQARRSRDQWVLIMSVLAAVFLAGTVNLVPPWIAGPAFGALVLGIVLSFPTIRQWVRPHASYAELVSQRRQLLRTARYHISSLEGETGLAWECEPMSDYNAALRQHRFRSLINLSRTGNLARYIHSRAHVRLYLMFILEAEKAYRLMQNRYLEILKGEEGYNKTTPSDAADDEVEHPADLDT